jgi:hypothetical protein
LKRKAFFSLHNVSESERAMASGYSVDMATGANLNVVGNVSAGNLTFMRNKVINGDARIDQRNAGAPTGVTGYGVDRFKTVSNYGLGGVVQQQVALDPADVAATGGQTHAVKLTARGLSSGLAVYLPFDGSTANCSESNITTTMTGVARYVGGAVGAPSGQALYLANEGNVLATSTKASNSLQMALPSYTTVTLGGWVYFTKAPFSGMYSVALHYGNVSGTIETAQIIASYVSTTQTALYANAIGLGSTSTTTININTWYHVVVTVTSTTLTLYINGTQVATYQEHLPAQLQTH